MAVGLRFAGMRLGYAFEWVILVSTTSPGRPGAEYALAFSQKNMPSAGCTWLPLKDEPLADRAIAFEVVQGKIGNYAAGVKARGFSEQPIGARTDSIAIFR